MIISKFPLAPSVNAALKPLRATGKFIKTREYMIFEQKVQSFKIKNWKLLEEINHIFKGKILRVDFYIVLDKKRIISKENKIKQIDYKNFIKTGEDGLMKCFNDIDDKMIKSGHTELLICDDPKDEQIIFNITIQEEIRTLNEFLKGL